MGDRLSRLDRNGDGIINNGTELFGDATTLYTGGKAADGFAALAQEDTNLDGKNDFYTVNGVANYFADHPIEIRQHEPVRIYLVNLLERDMINSFHIHANMFRLYRTGTSLTQYELTDTVIQGQGERAVLEFSYKFPGRYMFHAHKTEFAELGWMGFFDVKPADAKA